MPDETIPAEEYDKIDKARNLVANVDDRAVPDDVNRSIEQFVDWADSIFDRVEHDEPEVPA